MAGFLEGRCKGTNVCSYCAIQAAHENAKMLDIEARQGTAPNLLAIVGTRTPTADPAPFYRGREFVMRALRREFGTTQYASLCEFTTGHGERSGGLQRPHWNLFLKGIPDAGVDVAREITRDQWCKHTDAEPEAQYVEVVRDAAAAAKYVAMHFQKEAQAPPVGWRGQRFNCSREFFDGMTRREMRILARAELQRDRELWKVKQTHPELGDQEQAAIAETALWQRQEYSWTLVATTPKRAEELLGWH